MHLKLPKLSKCKKNLNAKILVHLDFEAFKIISGKIEMRLNFEALSIRNKMEKAFILRRQNL